MARPVFILLFFVFSFAAVGQDGRKHFSYSVTVGTGIPMDIPSKVSFTGQILGYYNVVQRFSVGAGTGIFIYERTLIPLFGDLWFLIIKPHLFTPYIELAAGYSFAPAKSVNGGFYLYPSVGTTYSLNEKIKLQFALGYELQKLKRLKRYEDFNFVSEFEERLNHHLLSIKAGVVF